MEYTHTSVLLDECIEGLAVKPDGVYVDCTLGRGGHSGKIAERLANGKLICIDRDIQAIKEASKKLAPFGDKVLMAHADFRDIKNVLDGFGIPGADGILFDLGVSSPQLDDASRGFSYMADAPLDMRMDQSAGLTAYEVVNGWGENELRDIFFKYGEERYSSRVASSIVRRRADKPVETTLELVDIIRGAMPAAALREKQHPAKRVFQAIRIAVNDELGALTDALEASMDVLNRDGRLVVISFHSLEDRIVKNAIRAKENGCTCPPEFPVCVCGFKQTMKSVTRKPILPSEEEMNINPRARSAKLRIAQRL